MAKKSTPFPSPAKAKSNLDAVVNRIEQKTGPLPKMPEALLNKPSMDTVNPSVIASVRDRAKDAVRSVGSGPSMNKTMPSPKYTPVPMPTPTFKPNGGRTAVPMPTPKQIGPKSKYTPVPMPTPKFGR